MNVNLILTGLQTDQVISALERIEAILNQLPESFELSCLNFDMNSQQTVMAWSGHLKNCQLWQVAVERLDDWNMLQAAEEFEASNPSELTLVYGTESGKKLGRRLAAKKRVDCHVDVQYLKMAENRLYASRKVYSTHIDGLFAADKSIVILSLTGPKVTFEPETNLENLQVNNVNIDVKESYDFLIKEEMIPQMEDLSKAKLVFLGGKGLGSQANFERLEALAEKLGASCGCTRPVALSAWAPYDKVVGISGWKLQADVCIAFGVAGAGPLMQGVEGVGKLVAINNDEKAQIFRYADYGVVEDCMKIIEAMENAAK